MTKNYQSVLLNNGISMPTIGYGIRHFADLNVCEHCLSNALQTGYRRIEIATSDPFEEVVGNTLKNSRIPREAMFISTKLNLLAGMYQDVRMTLENSFKNLQIDYVDLYLVDPSCGDFLHAWSIAESLCIEGKIRAIGLCNSTEVNVMKLLKNSDIRPVVNQIHVHPFYQETHGSQFYEENNIQLMSLAPFAGRVNDLSNDNLLNFIADYFEKTVAQVVLRWLIQKNIVVTVNTSKQAHIGENFDIFDFQLAVEDLEAMTAVDSPKRQMDYCSNTKSVL